MAVNIPSVKLSSKYNMPLLGLGTSGLSGSKATDATLSALSLGYRSIDTAVMYGNEAEIGKALGEQLRSGKVKREELFVTTKLENSTAQHSEEGVEPAIRESLQRLQLDYVDLTLIHWPVVTDRPTKEPGNLQPPIEATWRGLEAAVDKGLTRSIGISNFSSKKIDTWFKNVRIPPAVNQVEVHPHFRNDDLIKYCKEHDIVVTSYAPVSSPATMESQGNNVPNLLKDDKVISSIAEAHGVSTAEVMLAWHFSRNVVAIPRSGSSSHQKENLNSVSLKLSQEELQKLSTISPQKRFFSGKGMGWGADRPWKTYEALWDQPEL